MGAAIDRRLLLQLTAGAVAAPLLPASAAEPGLGAARLHAAIAKTDRLAEALRQRSGVPGVAVAIVRRDETLFAAGYGLRRADAAGKVNADTVFQLASLSKSIGATVIASQVSRGGIGWDTPVRDLLPWFELSDPAVTRQVTIGDFYAHRSGLPDHAGDELEDIGFDRDTILRRLRYLPLDGFRRKYAYTNFGVTAGAEAVTAKAGMDWASLSEQAIYQPLGMTRTSSRFADFIARPNHAAGHVPMNGKFVPGPLRDPDAQSPAGGVSSSVNDLAVWMKLVLGMGAVGSNQLIAPAALKPALSPQILMRPAGDGQAAAYYGFGFNVGSTDAGKPMLNHSGAFASGAATFFMLVPAYDLGIAVLTNAWPVGLAEAIGFSFFDFVQYGAPRRDWAAMLAPIFAQMTKPAGALAGVTPPAAPKPPRPLEAYAGVYGNAYYGDLTVSRDAAGLALLAGPKGEKFPCTHWDGDVFEIQPRNENATPGSAFKVTFSGTPVSEVTTDFFDQAISNGFSRRKQAT